MRTPVLLAAALSLCGAGRVVAAPILGDVAFTGDSITQGFNGVSYRYDLWKHFVDNGVTFAPVGSLTGFYQSGAFPTPAYKSQNFANIHEGHSGWRSFWMNGRLPLPAGRYNTANLGQGTVLNWTGQSTTFQTEDAPTTKAYTGTSYVPDTVVLMIGVNDLADPGGSAPQVEADLHQIVQQYQSANPNARVYVTSVLPVSNAHPLAATINPMVTALDTSLALNASSWSSGGSTVSYAEVRTDFDANTMTRDNTHPNGLGERIVARNFATALGIGPRDNTIGLSTKAATALATEVNQMDALPGTTAGAPLFRVGSGWSDPVPGDSMITLNEPSGGAASFLRSNWALGSGGAYTVETRLQMAVDPVGTNDFVMWSDDGTGGAAAGFLRIMEGKTEWGYGSPQVLDVHNNTDSFHDFRVSFDGSTYAVWRDGAMIADGLPGDAGTSAQNWLILGNFTGSESGHALLDYAAIETGAAYAPVPEPSALLAAGGGALLLIVRRRRSLVRE